MDLVEQLRDLEGNWSPGAVRVRAANRIEKLEKQLELAKADLAGRESLKHLVPHLKGLWTIADGQFGLTDGRGGMVYVYCGMIRWDVRYDGGMVSGDCRSFFRAMASVDKQQQEFA